MKTVKKEQLRVIRKVLRQGNSFVITIPCEVMKWKNIKRGDLISIDIGEVYKTAPLCSFGAV